MLAGNADDGAFVGSLSVVNHRRVALGLLILLLTGCGSPSWPDQSGIEQFCADWTQDQTSDAGSYLSQDQCVENALQVQFEGCAWDVWRANPHLGGRSAHYPGCDDGADL